LKKLICATQAHRCVAPFFCLIRSAPNLQPHQATHHLVNQVLSHRHRQGEQMLGITSSLKL
jgi:hypothetical protein